jgi:hypothetical protein
VSCARRDCRLQAAFKLDPPVIGMITQRGASELTNENIDSAGGRTLIFIWALVLRVLSWLTIGWFSGIRPIDLALFFDGHVYQLVARTFPAVYADIHGVFPQFPKSPVFLTAWFPIYPFLIWLVDHVVHDLRFAALIVSWLAGALAVVVFYDLAKTETNRPVTAALIFSVIPPTWLLCGSLAFVEPVFVCLLLLAVRFVLIDRRLLAGASVGLAVAAQKSGILIFPILALGLGAEKSLPRFLRRYGYLAIGLIPIVILQAYLWKTFGDPLINVKEHHIVYGGRYFAFPFSALVSGLLSPDSSSAGWLWIHKIMIACSVMFYSAILAASLFQREKNRLSIAWLGVVLIFNACLAGGWGYYAFARLMVMAAPAAVILGVQILGDRLPPWWVPLLCAPVVMALNAIEALGHLELASRYWTPDYFRILASYIRLWR